MGYLTEYADPEYCQEIPKFRLPMLGQGGTYRAFEIEGSNMLPIQSGTVIVGRYVQDWLTLKDGLPCIVVSTKEGIQFRRVYNKLKEHAALLLRADNPVYSPYEIDVEDVLEIWEAKAYISSTFPIADLSLNRLASIVLDLQEQMKRPPSLTSDPQASYTRLPCSPSPATTATTPTPPFSSTR